jgi:nucleoside-diphosphate-sugar epimerase
MRRALIIGGTGVVGRAVAARLLAAGWAVDVTGRNPAHVPPELADARFTAVDHADRPSMMRVFGAGADLVVDCCCYTAAHARMLVPMARTAGSTVMISSKAVYVDADGNHVNSATPPHFRGPIGEMTATMPPGDGDYMTPSGYGANKVAAERVLLDSGAPVTVLRPSKVHGPGGSRPREWVFVKRVLDRRPAVLLARRGSGVDHTTAAANLAALVELVADHPGARVLNSADPDAPDGLEIARAVAEHLGHTWQEVLLDEEADPALGRHPWDAAHPIVLDTTAAKALGYRPVGDFATTVRTAIDWMVDRVAIGPGGAVLAGADEEYFAGMFDYAAEDRYLGARDR